jgi:carbamoylphosphate synthase small subunit
MAYVKFRSSPPGHPAVLKDVLQRVAQTLSNAERTPSVMACLAEKILTLAASGETNPANLGRDAFDKVLNSCPACRGCAGVHLPSGGGTPAAIHAIPK